MKTQTTTQPPAAGQAAHREQVMTALAACDARGDIYPPKLIEAATRLGLLKAGHTPTPWRVAREDGCNVIRDANGDLVTFVEGEGRPSVEEAELTALIVRACNSYAANQAEIARLREALHTLIIRTETQAERLGMDVSPAHPDYVSKVGAARNLQAFISDARAALGQTPKE